jgi:hypothetical protein
MKASKRIEVSFSTESWEVPIRQGVIAAPKTIKQTVSEPEQNASATDELAVGILLLLKGTRSAA